MHRFPSKNGLSSTESGPSDSAPHSTHSTRSIQPLTTSFPSSDLGSAGYRGSQLQTAKPFTSPYQVYGTSQPAPQYSKYESHIGTTYAPQATPITSCGPCLMRNVICSGPGSSSSDKCINCSKGNEECTFYGRSSGSTRFSTYPALETAPLSRRVYSTNQEPLVPEPHQNRYVSGPEYRSYSNSRLRSYPSSSPHSHSPNQLRIFGDDRHPSHGQKQHEKDKIQALVEPLISRTKRSNSERCGVGYSLDEAWKNQDLSLPDHLSPQNLPKPQDTMRGQARQARPLTILDRLPTRTFASQSKVKIPTVIQDYQWQVGNVIEKPGHDSQSKLNSQILRDSSELLDAAWSSLRSHTASSSPTVSSDIDLVSVSGDSEATNQTERNSQGYRIFSQVFQSLATLALEELMARGESSSSSSKGKQVHKSGSASSCGTQDTASTRGRRRNRRQGDNNGDESRDRHYEPPKKKGKTSQSQSDNRSQFLACPYWKADSKKYWDCFLKKNDTIAHLKQHLTRRHTPKYYCQICYQTFRDFDLFDSHALERSCTRSPSAKLEGISQQQKNQLSLKSKGSVEQQWYTVWSILFPDMEPPATIYIYSTQSEDFCRIQEFAQREGVAIMMDELESNGLVIRPDASNQLLRSTVQRAMVSIFRSYSVSREPSSETEGPIIIQDLQPDNEASLQHEPTAQGQIDHGNLHSTTSADMNRIIDEYMDDSGMERLDRPSRSLGSQFPNTTSWLPRGAVQDNTEDEQWGPAFPDEPGFGESLSGNDLPFNFESSDMLDLDALLRDVISTEA